MMMDPTLLLQQYKGGQKRKVSDGHFILHVILKPVVLLRGEMVWLSNLLTLMGVDGIYEFLMPSSN